MHREAAGSILETMTSLPEGPLSLDRGFVATRAILAALPTLALAGLGLLSLSLTADDAARLLAQDEIAAEGARAEHARVDIERDLSFFVFRARRYDVTWEDARGQTHERRVREHDVSIAPLVVEGPPDVHYDPADPSRIAVGFARQNIAAQHAAIALLGATGLTLLGLACACFLLLTRTLRLAWRAAREGRVRVAEVVALERSFDSRGEPTGELHLVLAPMRSAEGGGETYRARDRGAAQLEVDPGRRTRAATPPGDGPVFLDAACTRVLAVTTPSGELVLVRRSGHPFRLAPEERLELTRGAHVLTSIRPSAASTAIGAAHRA